MSVFNVTENQVQKVRNSLINIRKLACRIDKLTYLDNKATGFENHIYQVNMSDYNGDIKEYEELLKHKIDEINDRKSAGTGLRIGYVGVPPMIGDIYDFIEGLGARVVYNEVQREFAFPGAEKAGNIYEQYYNYTYPYDLTFRIKEIKRQIELRKIDAVIHYTQTFCHRAAEDIIIKKELGIPVLTIEGDKINTLDARTKLRLEAFFDMLTDSAGVNL
jgi:benzoyl-CoA reductase/2-hydroxyglutaryl-CoA dehydratase subunit BcrC/BadD/HgdB